MLGFKSLSRMGGVLALAPALAGCNSMIPDTGSTDTLRFVQEIMPVQPRQPMTADAGHRQDLPILQCLQHRNRYDSACDPIATGSLPARVAAYGYSARSATGPTHRSPKGPGSSYDGNGSGDRTSENSGSGNGGSGNGGSGSPGTGSSGSDSPGSGNPGSGDVAKELPGSDRPGSGSSGDNPHFGATTMGGGS